MTTSREFKRPLEFAQSHDLARSFIPITLGGMVLGLFLLTPLDDAHPNGKALTMGIIALALSFAMLAVAIYRLSNPSKPAIVLDEHGILFRDLSDKTISWNEIRAIEIDRVSRPKDFTATKVTALVVTPTFLDRLTGQRTLDPVVARRADPARIFLSYYQSLPFEEFHDAVQTRWHALSHHARGQTYEPQQPTNEAAKPASSNAGTLRKAQGATVSRPTMGANLSATMGMLRKSSPGQLLTSLVLIVAIVILATNKAGLWSTRAQIDARAKDAEWQATLDKIDAEHRATAEDQRRRDESFKKAFDCLEQSMGTPSRQSPDCATKK